MACDSGMGVEVELKFRRTTPDRIRDVVRDLGGRAGEAVTQVDTYFAHPVRDFAKTDEALRVRIVGETGCVTYKGPLIDSVTKSREETELWFQGGAIDAERFQQVLVRLGFTPVRSVRKSREPWMLVWQNYNVEIAFDDVEGLGAFVELETVAEPVEFQAARDALLTLAQRFELKDSERRSYLALLLASTEEK